MTQAKKKGGKKLVVLMEKGKMTPAGEKRFKSGGVASSAKTTRTAGLKKETKKYS